MVEPGKIGTVSSLSGVVWVSACLTQRLHFYTCIIFVQKPEEGSHHAFSEREKKNPNSSSQHTLCHTLGLFTHLMAIVQSTHNYIPYIYHYIAFIYLNTTTSGMHRI